MAKMSEEVDELQALAKAGAIRRAGRDTQGLQIAIDRARDGRRVSRE
jgi:hypothetical protein